MQRTKYVTVCSICRPNKGFRHRQQGRSLEDPFKAGLPSQASNHFETHEGQIGQVKYNGDLSDQFSISNDVKQGCVLAPILFAIFFSMMLKEAQGDLTEGIYIRFRTDGNFFNLRRLLAYTKIQEVLIQELLFANDCAFLAHSEKELQTLVDRFSAAVKAFDLTISLKKTEVMHQKPPHGIYNHPQISIDGTTLKAADHLTHLGSVISNDASIDKDVDNRLVI